jgi:hypothetical protein
LRERQFKFLIYDADSGPQIYPGLTALLTPETRPAGLTPLYVEPDRKFVIYRLTENDTPATQPVARLEQGLTLQDYAISVSRPATTTLDSRDVGVFLRWRADRPVPASYKVFVHIIDDQGQIIGQDDGIPAGWTYPTNEWPADQSISDFHWIQVPHVDRARSYTVMAGLYDENSGVRLNRIHDAGKVIDDKIVLQPLRLDTASPASSPARSENK